MDPFAPKIKASSMLNLQELLEAQKNFLKYYELTTEQQTTAGSVSRPAGSEPDIVSREVRRGRTGRTATSRDQPSPQLTSRDMLPPMHSAQPGPYVNGWVREAKSPQQQEERTVPSCSATDRQPSADSDKENNSTSIAGTAAVSWARRVRKVAKLPSSEPQQPASSDQPTRGDLLAGLKRKSPAERRSPVPEKFTKIDKEVSTEAAVGVAAIDEATQTEAAGPPAVPSRVTLVSRKRIVGRLEADNQRNADENSLPGTTTKDSVPQQLASKDEPVVVESQKRPWRANMKEKAAAVNGKPPEAGAEEAKKQPAAAIKPWRTNMKPAGGGEKILATAEVLPKKGGEEKPWQKNMKKVDEKVGPEVVVTTSSKKRHYDPDEVKKYMLEKRRKEREGREQREREEWNFTIPLSLPTVVKKFILAFGNAVNLH